MLLKFGAQLSSPDSKGLLPLHRSILQHHVALTTYLLHQPDPTSSTLSYRTPDQGFNAVSLAVVSGNTNILNILLSHAKKVGADVTQMLDERGGSLIHLAAVHGHSHILSLLIENGLFGVDHPNELGMTPLHFAVSVNAGECVQRLVELGANVDAVDRVRVTPLHLAGEESTLKKYCNSNQF
jgi:E3 ubiquitin-protein ligase mind-bomb